MHNKQCTSDVILAHPLGLISLLSIVASAVGLVGPSSRSTAYDGQHDKSWHVCVSCSYVSH